MDNLNLKGSTFLYTLYIELFEPFVFGSSRLEQFKYLIM